METNDPVTTPMWRRELRAFGELFALTGLAFAQPVFDVFGRAPDQFIFRGVERGDIVVFALIVLLAPAALLHVIEFAVGLVSRRARDTVHIVVLGVLAAVVATLVADTFLPRLVAVALGALVGTGFAVLRVRTRGARIWLAFLTPAPIVFAAVFLLASQVAPLVSRSAGALGTAVGKPTPTVVVVFDELPLTSLLDDDGDIDADLFPNFARLADTSHWFRQTTTVSNYTWLALPALLTGMLPSEGTIPNSSSHPHSLFTLVGGAMPITSSEVVTGMCPASICERVRAETGGLRALLGDARDVLRQRLSPTDPDRDPIAGLVEDDFSEPARAEGGDEYTDFGAVSDRFARFVDRIGGPDRGLDYLHLLLPHVPYRHLADGTIYDGPDPDLGRHDDRWSDQEPIVDLGRQRHLLQLVWTDTLLGRIIDRLEEAGTWDDTNLIVTSDHGLGFEPDGIIRGLDDRDDDPVGFAEVAWVPFFVKTAGQRSGEVSDDPVRTVDLLPTIADLLDVDIPWETDGRSAFEGGSGDDAEVGMFLTSVGGDSVDPGRHATIGRDEGWAFVLDRAGGRFAPADGVAGADRIHRIGPRGDLWGRPVPTDAPELGVTIHPDSRADDVDLDSGRLPALFRADAADAEVGIPVGIAVNGTIWATTRVHDDGDGPQIAAILPREAFRSGSNDLRVHELGRTGS